MAQPNFLILPDAAAASAQPSNLDCFQTLPALDLGEQMLHMQQTLPEILYNSKASGWESSVKKSPARMYISLLLSFEGSVANIATILQGCTIPRSSVTTCVLKSCMA